MSTLHPMSNRAAALLLIAGALAPAAQAQSPAEPTAAEKIAEAEARERASDAQTSQVTIALIQLLVQEGVISLEKAQAMLEAAERQAAIGRDAQPRADTVRVPYVPETVKAQMREELRAEIATQAKAERWGVPGTMPEWTDRIEWSGDFRLRYHGDFLDRGNFPFQPDMQAINEAGGVTVADGYPLLNTQDDRVRMRARARVGLSAKVADSVKVGVRLATGSDDGPISTNETFGDYFSKDAVWIDRAFIDTRLAEGIHFIGGRMANPFWTTELVWDSDINPEGVALQLERGVGTSARLTATAGAFPLRESHRNPDQMLYGAQLGSELGGGRNRFRFAAAWYDFDGVQSRKNPPAGSDLNDWSAPLLLGHGNSIFNMRTDGTTALVGLASDFRLANVTAEYELGIGTRHALRLGADFVKNVGMDEDDIRALQDEPAIEPGDTGWQVKVGAGTRKLARAHDWNLSVAYRHLESDAVLAAFADSDFGVYGGTDLKGTVLEGSYGVAANTWLSLKWLSADAIERAPFASDVVLIDLNARF